MAPNDVAVAFCGIPTIGKVRINFFLGNSLSLAKNRDPETPRPRDPETPRPRDPETPRPRDPETPRLRDPETPLYKKRDCETYITAKKRDCETREIRL